MAKIIHILGLEHQIGDESVRKETPQHAHSTAPMASRTADSASAWLEWGRGLIARCDALCCAARTAW